MPRILSSLRGFFYPILRAFPVNWGFLPTFPIMIIRPALAADALAIAQTHVKSWQHAYASFLPASYLASLSVDARCKMWQAAIAKGAPKVMVAEQNGRIAGFAAIGPSRDEGALPQDFEIWAIYLAPESWGQGIGGQLWHAVRDFSEQCGAQSVSLWVIADNTRALHFYEAHGFVRQADSLTRFELGGVSLQEVRYSQVLA